MEKVTVTAEELKVGDVLPFGTVTKLNYWTAGYERRAYVTIFAGDVRKDFSLPRTFRVER